MTRYSRAKSDQESGTEPSQDQNHEDHEINGTGLLLPCSFAVPYIPKYPWLSFTGSLKSNASGNGSCLKKSLQAS